MNLTDFLTKIESISKTYASHHDVDLQKSVEKKWLSWLEVSKNDPSRI